MMAQLGDRRRRRTAQQLLGGCEVATEAVATQVGSRPMRPTLPAELSRRLVDAAVVAATDMSVPVTVVIVDESGRAQRAVPHGRRRPSDRGDGHQQGVRGGRHRDATR